MQRVTIYKSVLLAVIVLGLTSCGSGGGTDDFTGSSSSSSSSGSSSGGSSVSTCPTNVQVDFCEATGNGMCRYVDPVSGDDSNAGTYDAPWRTLANVNTTIYNQYNAPGWVGLSPGDVVYLKSGVYSTIYHPGDDGGPDGGGSYIFHVQGVEGEVNAPITLTRFPGHHPIIDPESLGIGIYVLYSRYINISGIEVRNAYGAGIRVIGSESVNISFAEVHDNDGTVAANVAGIDIRTTKNAEVSNVVVYDNYDRTAADNDVQTHNSCNMVLFANSGGIVVRDSVFYQTGDRNGQYSGCGLKYKHASPEPASTFEVRGNYFENHKYFAIGLGTANAHIHHNIINGAPEAIVDKDHGGPTHQNNQLFEYNTIYDARGFFMSPTFDYVNAVNGPWPDVENIEFSGNVIVDLTDSYNSDRQVVNLNSYMPNELHDALRSEISFENNCYYNPGATLSFGFAGADNYGSAGGYFDFQGWQTEYGFDSGSQVVDPLFNDPSSLDFTLAAGSMCSGFGAYQGGYQPAMDRESVFACEP